MSNYEIWYGSELRDHEKSVFKIHGQHLAKQFMQQAGMNIARKMDARFVQAHGRLASCKVRILILAGPGCNGGDGATIAYYLKQMGYICQLVWLPGASPEQAHPLCQTQIKVARQSGVPIEYYTPGVLEETTDRCLGYQWVVVDSLLGTGINRPLMGLFAEAVEELANLQAPIHCVDIPSGLDSDKGINWANVTKPFLACATYTLGFAKSGLFLAGAWDRVGELCVVQFGLEHFPGSATHNRLGMWQSTMPTSVDTAVTAHRSAHKYNMGRVLIWAGTPNMPGAASLAAAAAYRAGAGWVGLFASKETLSFSHQLALEVVRLPAGTATTPLEHEKFLHADVCVLGPGLGNTPAVDIQSVCSQQNVPLVIDADAIAALTPGTKIAPGSILTPHAGELQSLLGRATKVPLDETGYLLCRSFARQHRVVLLVKGAPTVIFPPDERDPFFCTSGSPALATAGTGDLLAGICGTLRAQIQDPFRATILAASWHGISGVLAAQEWGNRSTIATDCIHYLKSNIEPELA
ncbi:MAG: NAD(P)H-hydrate dehydratase [Zetaproteobacteria bacterium]|nr:NAD(P)H-hydrate dehydratase [Zetaproteobacteria bacterium]